MAMVLRNPAVKKRICGLLYRNEMKSIELSRYLIGSSVSKCIIPAILSKAYSSSLSSESLTLTEQERLISQLTVKVRCTDEAVLDSYTQFMQRAATVLNVDVSKKIIIPIHIEKRTLLKSPHIYKKHRVQYELRTHARMLQMRELTGDTADIFLEYVQRNIPEGVSMSVEQTELESIPEYIQSTSV